MCLAVLSAGGSQSLTLPIPGAQASQRRLRSWESLPHSLQMAELLSGKLFLQTGSHWYLLFKKIVKHLSNRRV